MLVSLVVPCYNMEERKLGRMMQSISNQTHRQLEVVLVDDGSQDDTLMRLAKWRDEFQKKGIACKLCSKPNGGSASAINLGLQHFTGEYICFPDADDELESNFISTLVGYLEDNQSFDVVRCNAVIIDETKHGATNIFLSEDFREHGFFKSVLIRQINKVVWPMLVRSVFLRERIPSLYLPEGGPLGAQEWQLLLPLTYKTSVAYINKPLYRHYIYPDSHVHSNIGDSEAMRLTFNERIRYDLFVTLDAMKLSYNERELYRDVGDFYVARLNMAFEGLSYAKRYGFALLLASMLHKYLQTTANIDGLMIQDRFRFYALKLERHFLTIC